MSYPTLEDVWRYKLRLDLARSALAREIANGVVDVGHPLFGVSLLDARRMLDEMAQETESHIVLSLCSSAEATIRSAVKSRLHQKAADAVSREIRKIRQTRKRLRLIEDVLETWRNYHPTPLTRTGDFKSLYRTRHWLAHGRHWMHGAKMDPVLTWAVLETTLKEMGIATVRRPGRVVGQASARDGDA